MSEFEENIDHSKARLLVAGVGKVGGAAVAKMTGHIYDVECCIVEEVTEDVERSIREVDALFVVYAGDDKEARLVARKLVNIAVDAGALVAVISDRHVPDYSESSKHTRWPAKVARLAVNRDSIILHQPDASEYISEQGLLNLLFRLAVQQITDLITHISFICVDFADVKAIFSYGGYGWVGIGNGSGSDGGARDAVLDALLALNRQGAPVSNALGILVNIYASTSATMDDFDEVNRIVHDNICDEAHVIVGITSDDLFGRNYRVAMYVVEGEPA
jgi:cell division GTPase FtsZ